MADAGLRQDRGDDEGGNAREMPFLDHLEELRWRIIKSLLAVVIGACTCFAFSESLLHMLTLPYEEAVLSLERQGSPGPMGAVKGWLEELRGQADAAPPVPEGPVAEAVRPAIPYARQLQSLRVMTWFVVSLQVSLLGGLILALPVVFWQFWQFVAPGLLAREKSLFLPIVAMSVSCFALGAVVAHRLVLPIGLRFFLSLEPADMTSRWAVDEYIGFVLRLLLGFGVVFELPVVSLFLSRLGLISPAYLRRVRRYAIVIIFVVSAVLTPPDPITQLMMAFPLMALYEVSIWVSALAYRSRTRAEAEADAGAPP